MKLENNWQHKSLENLEKEYWGEPEYDSYLVQRTHAIRKLPLNELTNDDVAMMIRQQFSLDYMIPLSIERLTENPEKDDDSRVGIIEAIRKIPSSFWNVKKSYASIISSILKAHGS